MGRGEGNGGSWSTRAWLAAVAASVVAGLVLKWLTGDGDHDEPAARSEQEEPVPVAPREPVRECSVSLTDEKPWSCTLDIEGPGMITITIDPSLKRSEWRFGIEGLSRLGSSYELVGLRVDDGMFRFRGTGSGTVTVPVASGKKAPGHELVLTNRTGVANQVLRVKVTFE